MPACEGTRVLAREDVSVPAHPHARVLAREDVGEDARAPACEDTLTRVCLRVRTPWGPDEVSCIERCLHFRGKFI